MDRLMDGLEMKVRIRRSDGSTYEQEYFALDLMPHSALRNARKDLEGTTAVPIAVECGMFGWELAEDLDAEMEAEARASDARYDGSGEPWPVRMRDVGVTP